MSQQSTKFKPAFSQGNWQSLDGLFQSWRSGSHLPLCQSELKQQLASALVRHVADSKQLGR
jgi:hypothetical protein